LAARLALAIRYDSRTTRDCFGSAASRTNSPAIAERTHGGEQMTSMRVYEIIADMARLGYLFKAYDISADYLIRPGGHLTLIDGTVDVRTWTVKRAHSIKRIEHDKMQNQANP
jgi:hypothetical protein